MNKEKIKSWLKRKHNLLFLAILVFAIVIRLYFFVKTLGQPLWWDEADYLAYAKNLAGFPITWVATAQHNSLYSFLAASIFRFGLDELSIKFLLQFIPSVLTIFLVYLIATNMYKDKRIGLISAFLMSVFWVHLFNSTRFHVDISGIFFGLLAIYVFWKGYERKEKLFGKLNSNWAIPLVAVLLVLAYSIRRGYTLFALFLIIYLALTKNWNNLFKDKHNWIGLIIGLVLFSLVEILVFSSGIGEVSGTYYHEEFPINFLPLEVFNSFFALGGYIKSIWLYLFIVGVIIYISNIALSFGFIKKAEGKEVRADLFNLLTIILTLAFFIFVLRSQESFGEPRWYLPLIFGTMVGISKGSLFLADLLKKHNKYLGVVAILVFLGIGGFYQLELSNNLINSKLNTFEGIKQTSLNIKEISTKNDLIITRGQPQVEYYSERKTVNPQDWAGADFRNSSLLQQHFEATMKKIAETPEAKFLIISFSEPGYPEWMRKIHADNGAIRGWEIPFMDSKIDFINGHQDIKNFVTHEEYGISFRLRSINQEIFLYEIEK